MKFSREWLSDFVDLTDLSDDDLSRRFTDIGHAVDSIEAHGADTVFDLEITTNRVDAMSHLGMARELAAALGRETRVPAQAAPLSAPGANADLIRIEAPELCSRYTATIIRGIQVQPSSPAVQRRLQSVGLRPINNIVDVTNYVMLALGHPLHAFDLDKLEGSRIIVRAGKAGESMKSLDGEIRRIDPSTVVIADARRPVALGGIIGGMESEITAATRNVLIECAWFDPSSIRRTARRLGLKTDASYRFERRLDPNDTLAVSAEAARMMVEVASGTAETPIDVMVNETRPLTIRLRTSRLHEASADSVGAGYALDLFRRLGFGATATADGIDVNVPTYRGDIHEEVDLVEEVLRFFGLDRVPASLPRMTGGDVRREPVDVTEEAVRDILVGCGLSEAVNYSFIRAEWNALFSNEQPVAITNALSENIASMRVSLLPGLLENVAFNRSYGTRDGALFEIGRTYHRHGQGDGTGVREQHRAALLLFGSMSADWAEPKRPADFFDVKGMIEQIAARLHVPMTFASSEDGWVRKGKRARVLQGSRLVGWAGVLASEILTQFGIKGDVIAAELDLEAVTGATAPWTVSPVARFPGVPMILAFTHARDLEYQKIVSAIRSFELPHLQEVGLRDRFSVEGDDAMIKTTLGMWYQAFDRSLTQEEVAATQQQLASRLADTLPVRML